MPSERDELLQRVYGRARRLWLTRRVAPVGAAALILIAGLAVIPRLGDDGRGPVRVAARDSGTTVAAENTADSGESSPAAPGETTTTHGSRTSTTRRKAGDPNQTVSINVPPPGATTSTTGARPADPCRNNRNDDPACGEFRWASDPGRNAPLEFTISSSPAQPKVGQQVTYTVRVVDPDASPIRDCGSDFDGSTGGGCAHTMECALTNGTWDVPPKRRGEATFTYTHTFTSPGQKTATFYAESMQGSKSHPPCAGDPNPYASEGSGSKAITVTA